MAAVDIKTPQGTVLVTYDSIASELKLPQAQSLVAYNVPAEFVRATFGGTLAAFRQDSEIKITQAHILAAVRGSVNNPKLRAWFFELDGHEFYVLRLGNNKTLVYDLTTEQWSWWTSSGRPSWRANIGTNWIESGGTGSNFGSNVIVGDDTVGILWSLNPLQGYDDPVDSAEREEGRPVPFTRVATGQVTTRGRITIPCYQVYAVADTGSPAYEGASVTLSYSDDTGRNFVNAGTIEVESGNYYQEFAWRSLGLVRSPGRLFRIEDDGAFAVLDELTIYDNSTS